MPRSSQRYIQHGSFSFICLKDLLGSWIMDNSLLFQRMKRRRKRRLIRNMPCKKPRRLGPCPLSCAQSKWTKYILACCICPLTEMLIYQLTNILTPVFCLGCFLVWFQRLNWHVCQSIPVGLSSFSTWPSLLRWTC